MAETNNRITEYQLKHSLQELYKSYIQERSKEYVDRKLTGQIIIQFRNGEISALMDQPIIAGASNLSYYTDKILTS